MSRLTNSVELILISSVILFLELACIRWFPAHVLYLTFFTNVVLLASFLGLSLGCLLARARRDLILATPFLLVLTLALGPGVELWRGALRARLDVEHRAAPEV